METPAAAPAPLPDATPVPSAARRPVEMPVVGTHYSISESVAQKGAHHIEYGKTLARRNATFAARQEFYYALQLVAQSYDNQAGGATHTQSLNKALTALREAEDFYVADSETQIGLNIVAVVETHLTKLVSSEEARSMTALKIMQIYCSYARDQFAAAGGHNVVSAEAFYCLGKLSSVMSKADSHANRLNVVKAIVYHRASLACDPNNYRSANELGTLLARNGQLEDAKELLTSSLLIQQTPPAWKNLSIVHRRLGENRLAQLAIAEYEFSLQAPLNPGNPSEIQWVAPEEFNSTGPIEYHESVARQPAFPVSPAAETPQPKSESLLDKLKNWF